jgi:putative ferrous iron transport protein C
VILSEIKKYLMQHKRATLDDLACHFDTAPEAMRGMLGQWIRKGRVIKTDIQTGCSKTCCKCCGCCDEVVIEMYEWKC